MEMVYERLLRKKIADLRGLKLQEMSNILAPDYAAYSKQFGFLQALEAVEGLMEEASTDMRKD